MEGGSREVGRMQGASGMKIRNRGSREVVRRQQGEGRWQGSSKEVDRKQGGRTPCPRACYAMRDMMIAVGYRNMVTNPLSWSSKSAFEPADKNKGFKSQSSLE